MLEIGIFVSIEAGLPHAAAVEKRGIHTFASPNVAPMPSATTAHQKTVALHTLGCKLNFSETDTIARTLVQGGYRRVDFDSPADLYVINTCSVTDKADKRFKGIVRKALERNPDAFIVAIGCYAQLQPEEIAAFDGVDMVLGAAEKFKLLDYLTDLTKNTAGEIHACDIDQANFYVGAYATGERTRAFLKVQDGCDYKCTYCTIPLARGRSRSAPLEDILEQAREIASQGVREIVLTGVNIGDYGKGVSGNRKHEYRFLQLIQALDALQTIDRIRISSIEPNLLTDEIIEFVAHSQRFVPHFHIPLQSGSDAILSAMQRRYRREHYAERIHKIKKHMPQACLGADVIVGFPSESEARFSETYDFLNQLDVSYLHVFTYSERPDTEALKLEPTVPAELRKKRSKMLRSLSDKKRRYFYQSQLEHVAEVLFEGENKGGYIHGFTRNYVKTKQPWKPALVNTIQKVKLTNIDADGLVTSEPLSAAVASDRAQQGRIQENLDTFIRR